MNVPRDGVPVLLWLDATTLVRFVLRDVARGRAVSIPTLRHKIVVALAGLLPKRILATRALCGRCVSMQHITCGVVPNTLRSGAGLFSSRGVPQNSYPDWMLGLSKVCQPDDFSEMKYRSPLIRLCLYKFSLPICRV